jgi:hypothetical protein
MMRSPDRVASPRANPGSEPAWGFAYAGRRTAHRMATDAASCQSQSPFVGSAERVLSFDERMVRQRVTRAIQHA